jgi:hypothetical protein
VRQKGKFIQVINDYSSAGIVSGRCLPKRQKTVACDEKAQSEKLLRDQVATA